MSYVTHFQTQAATHFLQTFCWYSHAESYAICNICLISAQQRQNTLCGRKEREKNMPFGTKRRKA